MYWFTRLFWEDSAIIVSYISLFVAVWTLYIASSLKNSLKSKARLLEIYNGLEVERNNFTNNLFKNNKQQKLDIVALEGTLSSIKGLLKSIPQYIPKSLKIEVDEFITSIDIQSQDYTNNNFDYYFKKYANLNTLITQIEEINKDNSWS